MKRKGWIVLIVSVMCLVLLLTGCSQKYQTKPDYAITERVTTDFINAYIQGDIDKAMENIAEECVVNTDGGELKGKENIRELIRINIEKGNTMKVAEISKLDDSQIFLIIENSMPLFQLAGVDVVKTKERFEVQDSKIVSWEIKYLKDSVDYIEQAASGSTGLIVEVKDNQMVVTMVQKNSPGQDRGIQNGDIIKSINGVELKDMQYGAEEIPYRLVGRVGSTVELEIIRGTEPMSVKLKRVNEEDFR